MIAATGLRKTFGATLVLEDVILDVPAGQCLAVLGPNGAGKTTLLRILATLARPSAGTLRIDGVDALREPDAVRARIGMVAHGSHVYEDLTALENLRFWAAMGGLDASPARLRERLQAVELDTVADERARTFSAGMKRRLGLARVTLGQPRLLLLDEPFNGLDRRGQKWLGEFLLAFKAGGGTIVLATHGFASALAVADRAAILVGGRIALDRAAAGLEREALHRLYDDLIEAER
ncbi:MAG TPA: heme ABC exporter ATP-binding protein CcmA [Methylomirabilota bacterium]|nr:heme ABC exporter ATP-binding protein CcmA [Methylomirabilota bacterium]